MSSNSLVQIHFQEHIKNSEFKEQLIHGRSLGTSNINNAHFQICCVVQLKFTALPLCWWLPAACQRCNLDHGFLHKRSLCADNLFFTNKQWLQLSRHINKLKTHSLGDHIFRSDLGPHNPQTLNYLTSFCREFLNKEGV